MWEEWGQGGVVREGVEVGERGYIAELEAHYPIRRSHLTGTLEPVQAFFLCVFKHQEDSNQIRFL